MPDRIVRRLNGPRGSVLLFGAAFCAAHVVSCLPPGTSGVVLPVGLDLLGETVPLSVYAGIWAVGMVLCVAGAFRRPNRSVRVGIDALAFGVTAGITLLWAGTYLLGWLFDADPSRQWVLAAAYAAIAGLITAAARLVNPGEGTR
jgi:hypothetical protein